MRSNSVPSSSSRFPQARTALRLARVLAISTRVVAWLFIPVVAWAWWCGDPKQVLSHELLSLLAGEPLTQTQRALGFVATLGSTLTIFYGMRSLSAICTAFCESQTFARATLRHYRRLSLTALWFAIFISIEPTSLALIVTLNAAPGRHVLSFSLGSDNLYAIFAALALSMLSAIMSQAHALQEECNGMV